MLGLGAAVFVLFVLTSAPASAAEPSPPTATGKGAHQQASSSEPGAARTASGSPDGRRAARASDAPALPPPPLLPPPLLPPPLLPPPLSPPPLLPAAVQVAPAAEQGAEPVGDGAVVVETIVAPKDATLPVVVTAPPPATVETTGTVVDERSSTPVVASGRATVATVQAAVAAVGTKLSNQTASTTVDGARVDEAGRVTSTTATVVSSTKATVVAPTTATVISAKTATVISTNVVSTNGGDVNVTRTHAPAPDANRNVVARGSAASPASVSLPTTAPDVPSVPATPTVPDPPSVPVTPAPGSPMGATHTAGSSSSTSDNSRGLQLLLFAVGATLASLNLERGRYVLRPRPGITRIGFTPVIERPG